MKEIKSAEQLSEREQEIFTLLLEGKSSKEIANVLKISGGTVNFHRNNIYKKLEIRSINELYLKYLPVNEKLNNDNNKQSVKYIISAVVVTVLIISLFFLLLMQNNLNKTSNNAAGKNVVFDFWFALGSARSETNVTRKRELINGKEELVVGISGTLGLNINLAGVYGSPNAETLELLRTMKAISFMFQGDGNRYSFSLPTIETQSLPYSGYDKHWMTVLQTENDEISSITIEIPGDLIWLNQDYIDFIQENVIFFQIQPIDPGDYNLRFWDIRLHL